MIRRWWFRILRRIDIDVLWPSCKARAGNIHQARAAFAIHAIHDPAWLILGMKR